MLDVVAPPTEQLLRLRDPTKAPIGPFKLKKALPLRRPRLLGIGVAPAGPITGPCRSAGAPVVAMDGLPGSFGCLGHIAFVVMAPAFDLTFVGQAACAVGPCDDIHEGVLSRQSQASDLLSIRPLIVLAPKTSFGTEHAVERASGDDPGCGLRWSFVRYFSAAKAANEDGGELEHHSAGKV